MSFSRKNLGPNGMIKNGDFSDGTNHWKLGQYSGGAGSMSVVDGELKLDTTKVGTRVHSLQITQEGLNIERGKTYFLTFDARCDSGTRSIGKVVIEKIDNPWTQYSDKYFPELTTNMRTFTYTFTASRSDTNARLSINCGKDSRGYGKLYRDWWDLAGWGYREPVPNETSGIILDNIYFGTEPRSVSGEFIKNGDFSNGAHYWKLGQYRGGAGSMLVVGDELKLDITREGTKVHALQITQDGLNIEAGRDYILTFDARCDSGTRSIGKVVIEKINNPWTQYSGKYSPKLTTDMQTFSYIFTASHSDPNAKLSINCGQGGTSDIILDNISLTISTSTLVMFDDFNYSTSSDPDITKNGWTVKNRRGGPGPIGSQSLWKKEAVSFKEDPELEGNKVMELKATTSGVKRDAINAELYTSTEKFRGGTYAARIRFSNEPVSGPDDIDEIIQTFFTYQDDGIEYGEIDFEYCPNGGWRRFPAQTLVMTSWDTVDSVDQDTLKIDVSGWHILFMTLNPKTKEIKFYYDGQYLATHRGRYYPEKPMTIRFNNWFTSAMDTNNKEERVYTQDVDWVYFVRNKIVSEQQIKDAVNNYRAKGINFIDTTK